MLEQVNLAPLEVRDLRVSYGPTRAVDGVSLEVRAGEIFGLLGPNGAGKTTTLSAIEGLLEPDSGSVTIAGIDRDASPRAAKARIGVQLQSTGFQPELTIAQITRLYAALMGRPVQQGSRDVLWSVGLGTRPRAIRPASGGQQRLSPGSPRSTILHWCPDEPTAGPDPQARRQLWNRIEKMRETGRSVLLTTHSMEEAQAVCDRVAIMDHGKILTVDTPAGLIEKHKNDPRVTSIAHGQVTLDDVFIGLTGEDVRD